MPVAIDAGDVLGDVGDVTEVAVGNTTSAVATKVLGVSKEIPAIGEFSGPAEIVTRVVHIPGLGRLKVHDGVELPAVQ